MKLFFYVICYNVKLRLFYIVLDFYDNRNVNWFIFKLKVKVDLWKDKMK